MKRLRYLFCSATVLFVAWIFGASTLSRVESTESKSSREMNSNPQAILALSEYSKNGLAPGNSLRFVAYSDRSVIYRERRKDGHAALMTGTIDDETWHTIEKIVAEMPNVKTNFAFTEREGEQSSTLLYYDGKVMREIEMYGLVSAHKKKTGTTVSYSTPAPAIKTPSPWWGSGEVPQAAIGAWYETHYYVPSNAHPWVPENFEVNLTQGSGTKTVAWPAYWPQPRDQKPRPIGGYTLHMPGEYLNEFEKLFGETQTATRISGETLAVSYLVPIPCDHELLTALESGESEKKSQTPTILPSDFLKKTSLADIKKLAREHEYRLVRIVEPQELWPSAHYAQASSASTAPQSGFVRTADVIEELYQSNNTKQIDAGLELAQEAKHNSFRIASEIASTHSPDETRALILRHLADRKFLPVITPLIQESVARGADYETVEPIAAYWRKLRADKEPLAWLPLHRTEMERATTFPHYHLGGKSFGMDTSSTQGKLEKKPAAPIRTAPFNTMLLDWNEEAAARCLRSWTKQSNGKVEAKLFDTTTPISANDITAKQLLKMQLDCLAGATEENVKLDAVTPEKVFSILFSTASNGGAYSHGEYGAIGRLATWQSVSAMVGFGADSSFDEVHKAATQCHWYSMASTAKWFNNIAWDFGVVCLREDERHIAVLAATDED